jgi:acetaldehyde dehydrogenase/alcohol dehydrogenase
MAKVDKLAEDAFDDQCTGANPRYPLIAELKEVLIASYFGKAYADVVDAPEVEVKEDKKTAKKAK